MEMPFDKQKNQRKAFCFVTFDSEAVVNDLLKTPKQTISGKEVDVKKATPKPENQMGGPMGMGRGGRMGMGGRGGRGGGRGKLFRWRFFPFELIFFHQQDLAATIKAAATGTITGEAAMITIKVDMEVCVDY